MPTRYQRERQRRIERKIRHRKLMHDEFMQTIPEIEESIMTLRERLADTYRDE